MSKEEADCIDQKSEPFPGSTSSTMSTMSSPLFYRSGMRLGGNLPMHNEIESNNFTGQLQSTMLGRGFRALPFTAERRTSPLQSQLGRPSSPKHDAITNFSDDPIVVVRRSSRKLQDSGKANSSKLKFLELKHRYFVLYINGATEATKLDMCNELTSLDVEVKDKYKELDFQILLNKNLVQKRINCLTQTLGILEKYASNLIKPNRPAFWRTVKFTSSLVKTYLENVQGSHDVLKQMGYAKPVTDGLSFPDDVRAPDVERIKVLAADLFLAKYEVDELVHDKHPYLQIRPATTLPVQWSVTRSLETGHPKVGVPGTEPGTSDSESEYEDAEDGLSTAEPQIPALQRNISPHATEVISATNDQLQCHVCGENKVEYSCEECKEDFCPSCIKTWHRKRPNHKAKRIAPPRTGDAEKSERSPSPVLYENAVFRPPVQPREQKPSPRDKKPIPKPRTRIPSAATKQGTTNIAPRQNASDVLPPPPMPRTTIPRNVSRETVTQKTTSTQMEREVKRPPPFDYNFLQSTDPLPTIASNEPRDNDESLYESLKMPSENIYEALDLNKGDKVPEEDAPPPPLPPRPPSKASSVSVCPHCFCLNEKDVIKCVACGTKLRDAQEIPSNTGTPVDNSAINLPVHSLRSRTTLLAPGRAINVSASPIDNIYAAISNLSTAPNPPGRSTSPGGFPGISTPTTSVPQWECKHCTYHNNMATNICGMCSKTTDKPVEVPSTNLISPRSAHQSYIQLQEQELHSYRSKSPLSPPPEFIKLQQMEEERLQRESSTNLLQKGNETAHQIQSPWEIHSLAMVRDPPLFTQLHYTSVFSTGGQGSPRVYNPIDEIRKTKEEGQQFIKLLKKAEKLGFAPDELNIAYNLQQNQEGPIHWLQNEWFVRMQEVMNKFVNVSKNETLGNLSPQEAREALIEHTGNVEEACTQCIKDRKKKLNEVMESGIYIRTDVIKSLDDNDGDVTEAIQQLQRMTFEPMLQRIKNSCLSVNDAIDNRPAQRYLNRQNSPTQDDEIFGAIVSDKDIDMDRRIRVMFAEKGFQSWGRAKTAIQLIDMEFLVSDSIEAAKANGDLERSIQFLQRECILCLDKKPENHMLTMLNCQCRFCTTCVSGYFKVVIHEQNIMKLVCPQCSEPKNLDDDAIATEYFNNLDILIRRNVDSETHDLFQRKLRDRTLMKEPNFRWCSHCSSGFINEQPEALKMACPHCNKYTCFQCKKQWEDQHEGITCERFAAWKEANDPEAQANGLAAHLKQNGIECPNCTFRYDLAKGGCMHFKCGQCNHEFCSGCYKPFRHNQHCPVSPNCVRRGLHAHHPRDCLFHLRDRQPDELKKLLDDHNLEYNTEPSQREAVGIENQGLEDDDEVQGAAAAVNPGRCKVLEQREAGGGLEDVECGRETIAGYAGLCRLHFTEYLVERINSNLIDPMGILSTNDLIAILTRNDLEPPAKAAREKDDAYHKRIVQFVQEKLPLPKKSPRRRVLDVEERPQPEIRDQMDNVRVIDLEQEDGLHVEYGYDSDSSDEPDFGYNDSGAEQSD